MRPRGEKNKEQQTLLPQQNKITQNTDITKLMDCDIVSKNRADEHDICRHGLELTEDKEELVHRVFVAMENGCKDLSEF